MTVPFLVPAYAALLVLLYIFLGMRVARLRYTTRTAIGGGGDPRLERAVRAHGNFGEYVPLAIILLIAMEMHRHSIYVLHALCLVFVIGRLIHAFGISQTNETIAFRSTGITLTWVVLFIAAIVVIVDFFRAAMIS
jgi:uncharacterized membrane protein YecN with MAPEG domain